jgi:hypothetical protein
MDAHQPAFPQALTYSPNGDVVTVGQYFDKEGISIRAYIATKAMAALITAKPPETDGMGYVLPSEWRPIISGAVKLADELIAELSKP